MQISEKNSILNQRYTRYTNYTFYLDYVDRIQETMGKHVQEVKCAAANNNIHKSKCKTAPSVSLSINSE